MPVLVSAWPATPMPESVVPKTAAAPDPEAVQSSALTPLAVLVMAVVVVSLLAAPRTTSPSVPAEAGAGRARASAVSTAARAPVPPASSCRLVLRAGGPALTCSVMASSRVAARHEQARQASASPALRQAGRRVSGRLRRGGCGAVAPGGWCCSWVHLLGRRACMACWYKQDGTGMPASARSVAAKQAVPGSIDEPLHVPAALVVSSRHVLADVPADLVQHAVRPRDEHVVVRVVLELELISIEGAAHVERAAREDDVVADMDRVGLERVDVGTTLQRGVHHLGLKDHLDGRAISDRVLEGPNVSGYAVADSVILIDEGPGHFSSLH